MANDAIIAIYAIIAEDTAEETVRNDAIVANDTSEENTVNVANNTNDRIFLK